MFDGMGVSHWDQIPDDQFGSSPIPGFMGPSGHYYAFNFNKLGGAMDLSEEIEMVSLTITPIGSVGEVFFDLTGTYGHGLGGSESVSDEIGVQIINCGDTDCSEFETIQNCPQDCDVDTDGDGIFNSLDDDDDSDGVYDDDPDNCPLIINTEQEDLDADGLGDACDDDIDGDGIINNDDNCPLISNPDQDDVCSCIDFDTDGFGSGDTEFCVESEIDCNDQDFNINPGATELCDGVDQNCNGFLDDDAICDNQGVCVEGVCVLDADQDGVNDGLDQCLGTILLAPVYGVSHVGIESYWGCLIGDMDHNGKLCIDDHLNYLSYFFSNFNQALTGPADTIPDGTFKIDDHLTYLSNFFNYFESCQQE